jgi:divalent metal cation (Fe/Co/Zn/Cd) transporter
MKPVRPIEFPEEEEAAFAKARRLEWLSIGYLASAAALLFLVMGSSQAMRTSWLEDMVSTVPPIAFLISSRVATRVATKSHPYGMHASVSIGYLTASLAIFAMGAFLLIEATLKLVHQDRATIGGFDLFGTTIWAGWPMLLALAYTGIPSFFLGRAKKKLAPVIHDKVLYADAEMNRADWMAESAAAIGVLGVGFGYWWADPVAAGLVSLDIVRDGFTNLRAAVNDLIDETPRQTTDRSKLESLPEKVAAELEKLPWIKRADVRMREEGHVFFGEAFVVPTTTENILRNIADAVRKARSINWRVHDLTIMAVESSELQEKSNDRK